MKKHGILQPELAEIIASLGHTDALVIGDAGLPVPPGTARIDLAVAANVPRFLDVLRAVLEEVQVEHAVIARETREKSPQLYAELTALLSEVPVQEVNHADLKEMTRQARAVVRTGEFTPYANVILFSGVVF